ncbi:hypothetical protein TWF192_009901 [Orbilia oligospora]|nr:hypothetical protein TWF192_009901 [Orbilia oligospora]
MADGVWHQSRCKVYRHLTKDRDDNSTDWNLKFSPRGWYRPKLYTPKPEYLETHRKLLDQFGSGENMSFDIVKWQGNINWDGDDLQKQEEQVLVANSWDLSPERMWAPPTLSSDTTLKGKRVKVFVRIAHIELIPESPEWGGGKWSLAGWINERIVANGIYCYSRENITETHLALRRKKHSLIVNSIQEIEPISVKENGAIVYTNIYESRIAPFSLVDRTKPGRLKLLVFHLCDPNADLSTTRDIIPQQPGAYEQVLRKSGLGLLPEDIFNLILQELEIPRMSTAVPISHRSILPTNNVGLPLEDSDSEDFGVGFRNSLSRVNLPKLQLRNQPFSRHAVIRNNSWQRINQPLPLPASYPLSRAFPMGAICERYHPPPPPPANRLVSRLQSRRQASNASQACPLGSTVNHSERGWENMPPPPPAPSFPPLRTFLSPIQIKRYEDDCNREVFSPLE